MKLVVPAGQDCDSRAPDDVKHLVDIGMRLRSDVVSRPGRHNDKLTMGTGEDDLAEVLVHLRHVLEVGNVRLCHLRTSYQGDASEATPRDHDRGLLGPCGWLPA